MAASRVTVASAAARRATAHIIHLPHRADESVARRSSSTDVDVIVHCGLVVQCLSLYGGVVGSILGWVLPKTTTLAPIASLPSAQHQGLDLWWIRTLSDVWHCWCSTLLARMWRTMSGTLMIGDSREPVARTTVCLLSSELYIFFWYEGARM